MSNFQQHALVSFSKKIINMKSKPFANIGSKRLIMLPFSATSRLVLLSRKKMTHAPMPHLFLLKRESKNVLMHGNLSLFTEMDWPYRAQLIAHERLPSATFIKILFMKFGIHRQWKN